LGGVYDRYFVLLHYLVDKSVQIEEIAE
jgi:hypothetical protein